MNTAGRTLQVLYDDRIVGTLALTSNYKVAFSYADSWLEDGFSISPFSLPLKRGVFVPKKNHFDGLYGVFSDSLPDAWGQLLLNRILKRNKVDVGQVTVLDRLAIVGDIGMGALSYHPARELDYKVDRYDLDDLAEQCRNILNTEYSDKLDELYKLGGTSGGARPKILTEVDGELWIIKFPSRADVYDSGQMEYDYAQCAARCLIDIPETRLFSSNVCAGYFGIKRFDREQIDDHVKRKHMLTAAALLELDFQIPCMDYHDLMKLTRIITGDNKKDVENMFRRMCFNVFAHNKDDHAKNFSYLYDEVSDIWQLSPAYDLTYSSTYYGEHTTAVNGNGLNPSIEDIIAVGRTADISKAKCKRIMDEIKDYVDEDLGKKYLSGNRPFIC